MPHNYTTATIVIVIKKKRKKDHGNSVDVLYMKEEDIKKEKAPINRVSSTSVRCWSLCN